MRFYEFLSESEGGMARRAEEAQRGKRVAFKNQAGDVITIITSAVFPADADPAEDPQQLAIEIADYVAKQGVTVSNSLTLPPGGGFVAPEHAGAALVMIFQNNKSNVKIAYIALKKDKKPGAYPIFLQTKQFSNLTGYVQLSGKAGEEDKVSGVQQRALTNLKPVGILPANMEMTIDSIPEKVKATIAGRDDLTQDIKDQVVQLLESVVAGRSAPVLGANTYAKSYEIDLGETAAPIALVKGRFLAGDWAAAETGMNVKFSSVRGVEFPNDPAEKLYDSYLIVNDKVKIRISSKDKAGGAKASVSGVVDDITNFPDRFVGLFDNPDFASMLDIIKAIRNPDMTLVASSARFKKNGAIAGALQLGIKTQVITKEQSNAIIGIINSDVPTLNPKQLQSWSALLANKKTDDATRPDYRIGWHLLAAVAAGAAREVNANYKTDAFFKAVLERSNMIQIKTSLKQTSEGAAFSKFDVIYPPVFTGTIKLDSGSNFYATRRPVGKMGFSIK